MKTLRLIATLALIVPFVVCVGCGGVSGNKTTTQQQTKPGTSAVGISVTLHQPGSQFQSRFASRAALLHPRPDFIDTYANGDITGYLNSAAVMTLDLSVIDWTNENAPTIPSGDLTGNFTASDGSTISWSSTLTGTTLNITASLNTIPGQTYTFGVVQTNGACTTSPCLSTNSGYVLAEGQTNFKTPDPPAMNSITLTLAGVLEAGYLCNLEDTSDCSTFPGPTDADGTYHYAAFPTDENGNPVVGYSEPSGPGGWGLQKDETPYDNGAWSIVILSGADVVSVQPMQLVAADGGADPYTDTTLGPFTLANPHQMGSGNWWDAEGFTVKCVKTGTAVVAMQMGATSLNAGGVNGFAYNSPSNYPATGALLGHIGSGLDWGNGEGVTFTCSGNTVITIN